MVSHLRWLHFFVSANRQPDLVPAQESRYSRLHPRVQFWLGREDSNPRIRDPKSRALPLGHAPTTLVTYSGSGARSGEPLFAAASRCSRCPPGSPGARHREPPSVTASLDRQTHPTQPRRGWLGRIRFVQPSRTTRLGLAWPGFAWPAPETGPRQPPWDRFPTSRPPGHRPRATPI